MGNKKNQILKSIQVYAIITLGLFIHALGVTAFLIPAEIVGGGMSGVATLVYFATGIKVGYTYLAINIVLILLAIKALGASFGIKTIYSVVMVSIFLNLQQQIITKPIIHETFMAAILGGLLAGVGVGLVFSRGGSTGGTDIIAMLINKIRPVSPGKIILYCDLIIISSSYFIFNSLEIMVYGFVSVGVVGYTIDLVLNGLKQSVQIIIISRKQDEIAAEISEKLNRGVTVLNGEGYYSKQEAKVLLTIVRRNEAHKVNQIIKRIDSAAFISQGAVMGVYGQGFDEIRG